ncbi:MAG TPA: NAD(P)H-hydrate dehydratase [Roseiflexaceae bacterium]|nr:NAD(P)H-hydrate dehydratase [Roseiflexaceae bacterium]
MYRTKVVTTAQMQVLEQALVAAGASWASLMEQAGWGVAQEALRLLGEARGKHVLVLVGPGNNGGDGLVVARHLHDAGAQVMLYLWRRRERPDDTNRQRCHERGIPEYQAADDADQRALKKLLGQSALIVDALLGMGVNRPVTDELAAMVDMVNDAGAQPHLTVLAIDLPTGVASDTGAVLDHAIMADTTVATGLVKQGLLLYPGHARAGSIVVADIGLTRSQLENIMSERIDARAVRDLLPARPDDSHKGTFGKAMVVAGSLLYPGASSLATGGAARVGAGLVTLATARSALGAPGRLPEVTLRPLPDSGGYVAEDAADELLEHLDGYKALLIGPGLGHEKQTRGFVERLFGIVSSPHRGAIGFRLGAPAQSEQEQKHELPFTVIDADGLNILSEIENWSERLPHGRCILTPHPGEMKRLLGVDELPDNHVQAAQDAARQWGQVVVLKGATTIVADPEGRTAIHDGGNAALATAGTGDVLAGAIVGLLAQGLEPFAAAVAGVYVHSTAGQLLRDEMGDAGTLASDLLVRLPRAIKQIKG